MTKTRGRPDISERLFPRVTKVQGCTSMVVADVKSMTVDITPLRAMKCRSSASRLARLSIATGPQKDTGRTLATIKRQADHRASPRRQTLAIQKYEIPSAPCKDARAHLQVLESCRAHWPRLLAVCVFA